MSSLFTSNWQNTQLFRELCQPRRLQQQPETESLKAWLLLHMGDIESLLRSAATSPTDFTLHNDQHAFRVAELMASIVPQKTLKELTSYELGLLLLAAYLHDIGMTPAQSRVNGLMVFMLGSGSDAVPAALAAAFQNWLDSSTFNRASSIADSQIDHEKFAWARKAVAHFCRFKHNDWSEEWIRSSLMRPDSEALYNGFIDDLISLCRSHHEGFAELVCDRFAPRIVAHGRLVNLRYLACVLRLADVCEVDPERTPDVILTHRDIDPTSIPFWHKDHDFSVTVTDRCIRLTAYPRRALIHRAIEITADQIEQELRLCERVAAEKPFSILPFRGIDAPHYEWTMTPYLHRTITPRNGTYEYIDGSFRPDTDKVLHLLGSEELYAAPIAAVRELLQNAFDAVLERMAYESLSQPDHAETTQSLLRESQSVSLEFEYINGTFHLRCTDTGAGMNKTIIRDHLLVSGMSERRDLEALERRCRERGTSIGRTAKFGIGVLSYFLLASELSIETRRLAIAGDDDGHGWQFTTNGVGSFGELTRRHRLYPGTVVDLTLRDGLFENPVEWWQQLRSYLAQTLSRIPCKFRLSSPIEGCNDSIEFSAGWTRNDHEMTNEILQLEDPVTLQPVETLTSVLEEPEAKEQRYSNKLKVTSLKREIASRLRWKIGEEFPLANVGLGRISLPYFELNSGRSPIFFDESSDDGVLLFKPMPGFDFQSESVTSVSVAGDLLMSWKGMRTEIRKIERQSRVRVVMIGGGGEWPVLEIDCNSTAVGRLGLSREWIQLANGTDAWSLLRMGSKEILEAKRQLCGTFAETPFSAIAHALLARSGYASDELHWIRRIHDPSIAGETERFVMEKVRFPLMLQNVLWKGELGERRLTVDGIDVTTYSRISVMELGGNSTRYIFIPKPPSRLVGVDLGVGGVVIEPIWDADQSCGEFGYDSWSTCRFPLAWKDWVGVWALGNGVGVTWNRDHPLTNRVNWGAAIRLHRQSIWNTPRDEIDGLLQKCEDKGFAQSMFLDLVAKRDVKYWNGILARERRLAELLWQSLNVQDSVQFIVQQVDKDKTIKNSKFTFTQIGATEEKGFEIPIPEAEFVATRHDVAIG